MVSKLNPIQFGIERLCPNPGWFGSALWGLKKKNSDAVNVIQQSLIFNVMNQRKIKTVGQRQVVQPIFESEKLRISHLIADDGEINIRSGAVITFCARSIEYGFFDSGEFSQYALNLCDDCRTQSGIRDVNNVVTG